MNEADATDDMIQRQMEAIEDEVKKGPPIDERRPIDIVLAEYSGQQTDAEFTNKAKELGKRFKHIRKVRGDGNCFYRAMVYAICEQATTNTRIAQELRDDLQLWKVRLVHELGFPGTTTEDFIESVEELLGLIIDAKLTGEQVRAAFNGEMGDYYVVFGRLLTSGYLQMHDADYAPFITGHATVKEFCIHEVDPMARECDHMCVMALVNALRTPVHIEYLDRTHSQDGTNRHEILPNLAAGVSPLCADGITMLYRPGHYDILYE